METKKKGIIIFLVFLSVLGISYIYLKKDSLFINKTNGLTQKEIDDSLSANSEILADSPTKEIDGRYIYYSGNEKIGEFEFKSGRRTQILTVLAGTFPDDSFSILDNDTVEIQFETGGSAKYLISRNDKNEVISLTDGDSTYERVKE